MKNINTYLFSIVLIFTVSCSTEPEHSADLIITNANVWTGNDQNAWAQTIAIKDGRIIAVGNNTLATQYETPEVIDADGKLILPGFIDNHTHFMDGAASLLGIKTQYTKSSQEFIEVVKNYASSSAEGEWITGGLWDHEAWEGNLPRRDWIDEFTINKPLFLQRTDGHMALANSAVLEIAGITDETPDPVGGTIVRDENGVATGVLKDNAMNYVWEMMPTLSKEQADRTFDAGIVEALKNGVTQIHNMSNWDNIEIFKRAKTEGRLKIRTYYFPHISNRHKLAKMIKTEGKGDDWLRFGGVKELADGSLGSMTAWFYAPYTDEPETNGFPLMKIDDLKTSMEEAHAYGFQLAVHGIGDQTNDEILKLFETIGVKGHRARIEHAQHLTPEAIKKFKELGAVPSVQPYHAIDDGRWAEKRIGPERLSGTYPFKSLFDAGATVTFGSDWSVAPLEPLGGIYAAVTRQTLDGKNPNGWVPEQKITVEQAVKAYTYNNAWAGNQENDLGTIEIGKLADLVMISDNIFEIAPEKIKDAEVQMTIIGGKIMYKTD